MRSKYVKFVNEEGDFFYDVTLPSGELFEKLPKALGDYLFELEKLTEKE